ncbi:Yia6p [Sugiyamaella lignohabitans]|uniref:Yia6p n=1 Tax=Sugiyamaella lignohabitans TaxID=796027 RepID=A0A167E4N7_9ASCO|nr:Yia6p [Sugiyamaella lignohabitans]ANB13632.1 Yia6p [Sugiyamaella lignohabitans]
MSDEDGIIEVNTHRVVWHERPLLNLTDDHINAISGAIAGVTSGVAVCPLDVAKTRLQAQGGFSALQRSRDPTVRVVTKYSGLLGTVSTIFKDEGVRGLYRGLTPIIIGYIPTWTIYFMLYEKTKRNITPYLSNYPTLAHIASAITGGATSTLVTNPIWVVKTRLMSQNQSTSWHYKSTWDAVSTMYRTEGISVFYSGLGPALLGLCHVAIQFPLYEKFKQLFTAEKVYGPITELAEHMPADSITDDAKAVAADSMGILLASSLSKVIASSITYPHEVIRTRNQIQNYTAGGVPQRNIKYHGIVHTAKTIFVEEGWRAFYAGLGTNMFRAVPSSAVTLLTYEIVSGYLRRARDKVDRQT